MGQPSAKIARVTPEMAAKLLERNVNNRQITRGRVRQYVRDILNGDWQVNGESIKVGTDGRILDGQHRLLAVIEADRAIDTVIITGLRPESQETMDQGQPRKLWDILKMRGEGDYFNLASAARIVCLYERDGVPYTAGRPTPTVHEMLRTLKRNPELRDSLRFAARMRQPYVAVSMTAGMHYLFSIVSPAGADSFWQQFARGEGASNAAVGLREALEEQHVKARGAHARLKVAMIAAAWADWRAGVRYDGRAPSPFPGIDGLTARSENEGGRAGDSSQGSARPSARSTDAPASLPERDDDLARALLEAAS